MIRKLVILSTLILIPLFPLVSENTPNLPGCVHTSKILAYEYLEDFSTEIIDDENGKPFLTSGKLRCNLDPSLTRELLKSEEYYNFWVIPGLNANEDNLHTPMVVYNAIHATSGGKELVLDFSLTSPIRIDNIKIPFTFSCSSKNREHILVQLVLKDTNPAFRNAKVRIELNGSEQGTIVETSIKIDFTFLVDLFLNKEFYADNTEERMQVLIENFLLLTAREIAARDDHSHSGN